jgi:hypothetical protein
VIEVGGILSLRLAAAFACLLLLAVPAVAATGGQTRGESDEVFAKRRLQLNDDAAPHVTRARWNSVDMLFVDYVTAGDAAERVLVVIEPQADRVIQITTGEHEGGVPDIAAIGFANADDDPAQELIVLLAWRQNHPAAVVGTLYDVRIFDDAKPGATALPLLKISEHFGMVCDCTWHDGTKERFRFKTIAAIKAELKRLGY